jgi:hypothetical protein
LLNIYCYYDDISCAVRVYSQAPLKLTAQSRLMDCAVFVIEGWKNSLLARLN